MGVLIAILLGGLVVFLVVNKKKKQIDESGRLPKFQTKEEVKKTKVSSVLDANGHQAADIIGAINSGDWDWARAALQKLAYNMVGDDVTQAEKDEFRSLMTYFAERDPLYHALMAILLPVIREQPGIMQSKIYEYAP